MDQLETGKKRVTYFEDNQGNQSSMRLMSFIALITAIVFGGLTIMMDTTSDHGIFITFGFLLSAFAPKALQKFAETKILKWRSSKWKELHSVFI